MFQAEGMACGLGCSLGERWEPLRVLSRGGNWPDSGAHRRPLASMRCNGRSQETRPEVIALTQRHESPGIKVLSK